MHMSNTRSRVPLRKSYSRLQEVLDLPPLIEVQHASFRWFLEQGLRELFDEISPIVGYNKNLELWFGEYRFGEPKYTQDECRERDMTYAAPLWVKVKLVNKETGEIQEQEVFMGDFPMMTERGTFIVNGAERVVVSQLIRSPGAYFTLEEDRQTGRELCYAKLIPGRGAWLEFETSRKDVLSVKIDRKRKIPLTTLLRALAEVGRTKQGYDPTLLPLGPVIKEGTDEELLALFEDVDIDPEHPYIQATIERDATKNGREAIIDIYKRLRPGDPPTEENARTFIENMFFDPRRYDLGRVGRYKMNRRLGIDVPERVRTLTHQDFIAIVRRMIQINNRQERPDDIDHLGNRRVKTVGELIQNQLRIGLLRMERVVRERMSIREPDQVSPVSLINIRPVVAAIREFFGGSPLSQFMDQTNPLSELTHKRRLSALGPGGLRRERAGFDVRDVHHSHYGRICPIETPEGPNIGLIGSLATYARVNEYGFLETPVRRVRHTIENDPDKLVGRTIMEEITDPDTGEVIARRGDVITEEQALRISALADEKPEIRVRAYVTDELIYVSADEEDRYVIAQASTPIDGLNQLVRDRVSVRRSQTFTVTSPEEVDFVDVSPKQIVSVSSSLIPFLEHDDANRALMGSNMQRQAVPLIKPSAPLVGTGVEYRAARDSGQVLIADKAGEVVSATSEEIVILGDDGERYTYPLLKFRRSNQSTSINQRPIVKKGDRVEPGDVLADTAATDNGELALGQNVLVAFISWEGAVFEDAIVVSERLVHEDYYSSIHIERYEAEARDTKLGPEEITRDIPGVSEEALRDLDEDGIIRIGAYVKPGDILVGKVTPKGETDLTPEEKLLRAIFGEKIRDVKDSSLKLPHGEKGKVVDVKVFGRDEYRDLPAGVEKMVRVSVAQRRRLLEGDKMAGRHGNKGVVSKIVPVADMPFLPDGTPVDIILNPLGVPGRMNIGQVLETHLGWAADRLGFKAMTPVFDGAKEEEIEAELARAWLIDKAWRDITERAWAKVEEDGIATEEFEDDEEVRRLYIIDWLTPLGYDAQRLLTDRVYARRSVLTEWLRERGYDPQSILAWEDERLSLDERRRRDTEARRVGLREWLLHHEQPLPDPDTLENLLEAAEAYSKESGWPTPISGKMVLYDGKTGEPYDQPVMVGYIYMMKLNHMVEDKVHARSTGPYSLVTQQPLGGKAQFGGQRFGEMEVWALEAYGAAYALQEILTIKSDDISGRVKTYEAIVKGEPISPPGVPESFRVLVKELQALGLAVEVINERGEVIRFGKEVSEERLPKLGFSLSLPGVMTRFEEEREEEG